MGILISVPQFGFDLADSVIVEQGFGWGYAALVCCGHTPFARNPCATSVPVGKP